VQSFDDIISVMDERGSTAEVDSVSLLEGVGLHVLCSQYLCCKDGGCGESDNCLIKFTLTQRVLLLSANLDVH
jgi:hypothetical protein